MFKKVLITLFLTLFVTACSSSGKLTQTVAPTSAIDHTAYANLRVSTGQEDDAKDFANRLQDRLFGKLVSRKVFTSVNQNDATAKYDLEITISGAKKVSGAARVLFGVFAGSNNVTADVTLTDKNTGEVITTFKAEGKSASHPFSSESGAEDAIREVSEQIVTGLL